MGDQVSRVCQTVQEARKWATQSHHQNTETKLGFSLHVWIDFFSLTGRGFCLTKTSAHTGVKGACHLSLGDWAMELEIGRGQSEFVHIWTLIQKNPWIRGIQACGESHHSILPPFLVEGSLVMLKAPSRPEFSYGLLSVFALKSQ